MSVAGSEASLHLLPADGESVSAAVKEFAERETWTRVPTQADYKTICEAADELERSLNAKYAKQTSIADSVAVAGLPGQGRWCRTKPFEYGEPRPITFEDYNTVHARWTRLEQLSQAGDDQVEEVADGIARSSASATPTPAAWHLYLGRLY